MKSTLILIFLLLNLAAFTQTLDDIRMMDSFEKSLKFEHGTIDLNGGFGKLIVPEGFKYLNKKQAEMVLYDLWGNPKNEGSTLGLLMPQYQSVFSDSGYVFDLEYDEMGYVKDNDADDINYDDLLKQMKEDAIEVNKERKKQGYPTADIVGWAAKPFYDKERKILHWAKEIKFDGADENTLNYNVRVLGRKGVMILNAISTANNLPLVQKDIPKVLDIVQFNDGHKYKDFDPKVDNVAAWTIGGLVAGKVLAKVGFFALIVKFWKLIALAAVGFFSLIRKKLGFRKKSDHEETEYETISETTTAHSESTDNTIEKNDTMGDNNSPSSNTNV